MLINISQALIEFRIDFFQFINMMQLSFIKC